MPGAPTPPPRRPGDVPEGRDRRRAGADRRPDRDAAGRNGTERDRTGGGQAAPTRYDDDRAPRSARTGPDGAAPADGHPAGSPAASSTSIGLRVRGGPVPRDPGESSGPPDAPVPPARTGRHGGPPEGTDPGRGAPGGGAPGREPAEDRPWPPRRRRDDRPDPPERPGPADPGPRSGRHGTPDTAGPAPGVHDTPDRGTPAPGRRARRAAETAGTFGRAPAPNNANGRFPDGTNGRGPAPDATTGRPPVPRSAAVPGPDGATRRTARTGGTTGANPARDTQARATATPVRRRRRPAPSGPLGRVAAFTGPTVGRVRRRLGILDADAKAALTPAQRRTRRRQQIKWSLIGTAASFVLLPLLMFGIGWAAFGVPNPDDAVNNQVATVSFADGGQLARLVPEQGNRIKVGMNDIPVHVREAVLAAEDRSFYTNPGFDLTGILRAAGSQLLGGDGGGSTITQQYVKNTLVGNEASYWRKYKELIVSLKVSQYKTKDEILNDYLNAIYFGRGAYGIQSASLAYFGKPANQLSPSEGALLAGVIQSPSRWDPAIDQQKARERWSFVMDGMVQQGWLSREDKATAQFPVTIPPANSSSSSSLTDERGHILNAVKAELSGLGISDQAFAQGGLQVTTTIDPGRQRQLTDAVNAQMQGQPDVLRAGAVAIDPKTGGIVGYYGGKDGTGIDYAKVLKQPGSTFKPFVVLAALLQDPPIGLGQKFDGSEQEGLRNAEGANCPRCDLKQALTISNNVVFTKLSSEVGPQKVADAARLAGITQPLDNPDARIALGNKETTPLQLASAYATIADGGVWHAPHFVSKVVDSDGRVLYEYQPGEGEQRFSEQVARNVTEGMLDVVDHDDRSLPSGQEAAAKTGTVQSRFEGQNNDAWFSGFTPDLVSTVWIGTDRNDPIQDASGAPINGADLPGAVWQAFMSDAVKAIGDTVEFPAFRAIGKPPSDEPANAPTTTVAPPPPSTTVPPTPQPPPSPEPQAPAPPPQTTPDPGRSNDSDDGQDRGGGLLGGPDRSTYDPDNG